MTQKLADRAQLTQADQRLVIVTYGTVRSAPRVMESIQGGMAQITGSFTVDEVKALATALKAGDLPVALAAS